MINYSIGNHKNKSTGLTYYYAMLQHQGTVSTKEIAKRISKECTVSFADVLAVLQALGEDIPEYLRSGRMVKLDGIGTIWVSIRQNSTTSRDDFNSQCIKGIRATLKPQDELNPALLFEGCEFEFSPTRKEQQIAKQAAKSGAKLSVKE